MEEKTLYPSCSEMVFRLSGGVEEVKNKVIKMIDIVKKEQTREEDNKQERKIWNNRYNESKKEIMAVKEMEDFDLLCIPYTCSYETFFQPDDDGVIVATCNNHDWEEGGLDFDYVESESGDPEYYKYARYHYYDVLSKGEDWVYAEYDDEDNNGKDRHRLLLEREDGQPIVYDYGNDKQIRLVVRGDLVWQLSTPMIKMKKPEGEKLKKILEILCLDAI